MAGILGAARSGLAKPVAAFLVPQADVSLRMLGEAGIPAFRTPESCADVIRASTVEELRTALATSRDSDRTTVVEIRTDPLAPVPSSESWWDVPVAEVAELPSTKAARTTYERGKAAQRGYLRPADTGRVRDSSPEGGRG